MPAQVVQYIPRVIVKFHDVPYDDKSLRYDPDLYLDKVARAKLHERFPGTTIERVFKSVCPQDIRDLAVEAQHRDPTYHPPNFLTYFAVRCPKGLEQAAAVAKDLSSMEWESVVERAYVGERPTKDPVVTNPDDNPERANRKSETDYLRKAPGGIDADYAWEIERTCGIAGGDGGGAAVGLIFVDIEQAWMIQPVFSNNHEDLPQNIPIDGVNQSVDGYGHGTADLGIVAALHNNNPTSSNPNKGSLGITPNVASVRVVSRWRNATDLDTADAIKYAINSYSPAGGLTNGDVLLLEAQTDYPVDSPRYKNVPIEVHDHVWQVIREAIALGVVVVEAAGNGGMNLDDLRHDDKGYMFDRDNVHGTNDFQDSGAILVAAATSRNPHARLNESNFGSRIDCYAWGENIRTTWHHPGDPPYADFGGTSGASAIIAGAALSVQGIYAKNLNTRIPGVDFANPDAVHMRRLLSDPTRSNPSDELTGATLSANSRYDANRNADKIGVMPNLQSIIRNKLNLVPDVYIRDFVADDGTTPHSGPISSSPDIILNPAPVADPQAEFGEANNANRDNVMLSVDAVQGQDHFIYVRVRNRGSVDATNVQATVYWSEPATLVIPDPNKVIGSTVIPSVPAANVLTVSPPIKWAGNSIPPKGHYCFVCLIDNACDPAPPRPADFLNFDNFLRFIRENNNVTWRNFNVVDNAPPPAAPYVELPFNMNGAFDQSRRMRLEVIALLPAGAQIKLEVPIEAREILGSIGGIGPIESDEKNRVVRILLNPHGASKGKEILFTERKEWKSRLLITIPDKFRKYPYEVSVRQLFRDQEVGRVTWRLVQKKDARRKSSVTTTFVEHLIAMRRAFIGSSSPK